MINIYKLLLINAIINQCDQDKYKHYNSEVFNRWDGLGFLQGLDEERKIIMSNVFEEMAKYLLGHNPENKEEIIDAIQVAKNSGDFEMLVLPLLRRIYINHNLILAPDIICMLFGAYFPPMKKRTIRKYGEEAIIDIEAESLANLCSFIGNKYGRRRI